MARKIRVKLILELREQGMSRNQIAKTRHVAKLSVCEVFDIAQRMGIGYKDIEGKSVFRQDLFSKKSMTSFHF
jgi:hypothetical protein